MKKKIRLFTIPNILTLANSICGALAVVALLTSRDYTLCFILILLAGLCDLLDGLTARLLGISSPLGVELDSLADVVSFGLAPSLIMMSLVQDGGVSQGWMQYLPLVILSFSTLRLAKFNIDEEQSIEFIGLPTPACALMCASLGLLSSQGVVIAGEWIVVIAILLALLLISPIRMFSLKFKGYAWRFNIVRYGFLIASALIAGVSPLYAMPIIITLYIVVSMISHFTRK